MVMAEMVSVLVTSVRCGVMLSGIAVSSVPEAEPLTVGLSATPATCTATFNAVLAVVIAPLSGSISCDASVAVSCRPVLCPAETSSFQSWGVCT